MTDFSAITTWFTGKALQTVRDYVLPTLAQAEAQGYWPKGASRKVYAALNKQSVAHKFARANDRSYDDRRRDDGAGKLAGLLDDVMDDRCAWHKAAVNAGDVIHAMMFGQVGRAPECLAQCDKLAAFCVNAQERAALAIARQWSTDFAPVGALVKLLDSRRPIPVIVCKTLSPTVLANVGRAMGIDLTSIECPKIVWEWKEHTFKDGTVGQISVPRIIWPEGTKHRTSRFAYGTASNQQCHACGHAIKNAFNWIPLVAQTAAGPVSLWVGRDCAKNLFGCEIEGEADYSDRGVAA